MKKGYLGLAMENILSIVIILVAILLMTIALQLSSDKGSSKLYDSQDNYVALRELNQLLNSKTTYLDHDYRLVDLLATLPEDESVTDAAFQLIQDYYPTEIISLKQGYLIYRTGFKESGIKIGDEFIVITVGDNSFWEKYIDNKRLIDDFKINEKKLLIAELSKEAVLEINEKHEEVRIAVKHILSINGNKYAVVLITAQ